MKAILTALAFAVLAAVSSAHAQGPTVMPLHEEPQPLADLVFADESGCHDVQGAGRRRRARRAPGVGRSGRQCRARDEPD